MSRSFDSGSKYLCWKEVHEHSISRCTGAKHPQEIEEGGREMSGKQALLKFKRPKEYSEVIIII